MEVYVVSLTLYEDSSLMEATICTTLEKAKENAELQLQLEYGATGTDGPIEWRTIYKDGSGREVDHYAALGCEGWAYIHVVETDPPTL